MAKKIGKDRKRVGRGVPPEHTKWKKGVSGNPLGGKLHNPELRAIKRLTAKEVAEVGSLIVQGDLEGLKTVAQKGTKHSVLQVWIASIAIKAIEKGDSHALDTLLNRLVGKTPEKIEMSGPAGGPIQSSVDSMTHSERVQEIERLRKLRKETGED